MSQHLAMNARFFFLMLAGLWLVGSLPAAELQKGKPNRLAQESSPYLRQHAYNPVDWYPWGSEAFAKAKKEKKLVFLSIGYSSCHWCHVMERESFANLDVAKLLNDWFVCIKVDREERPDIDNIYMTALHMTNQRGGWPLSMFLLPDGKPIIGGTYWPPDDKEVEGGKIRGFKSILTLMHEWQTDRADKLQKQAEELAEKTTRELAGLVRGKAILDLDHKLASTAVEAITEEFDPQWGGFGNAQRKFQGTKFPQPSYLQLLLYEARKPNADEPKKMLLFTLDKMAQGGIYDHLGGGFHRYSTERTWTVPHFEKMLYDNAQLAEVYAEAYRLTKNPVYARVVRETLAFVDRELTSPEGGFYSALDADSEEKEGQFYVWTPGEIDAALPAKADADVVKQVYGVSGTPNFEGKHYILLLARPLAETAKEMKLSEEQLLARLAPLKKKLFDARSQRPRPFLDTKILTSWNGQMIAGYAVAGRALNEPGYLQTARKAADFLLTKLRTPDGRLLRTYGGVQSAAARLNGYLDDYAYLTHGLLCLHDATGEPRWLQEAQAITDRMLKHFSDPDQGGLFYTSDDHEKLFARSKDQYDGAQPSANSVAALNLVRLFEKTKDARYRKEAERNLRAFATQLKVNPTSLTGMALAVAHFAAIQEPKPIVARVEVAEQAGQKSDSVVKVSAKAEPEKPGADGKQTVTVTFQVNSGWHVYANPPGNEDLESVKTTLAVTSKPMPKDVNVEYPDGKQIKDPVVGAYKVYEGKVTIKMTVVREAGDTGPLEISAKFQACNDKMCLIPATKKLTVP